VPSFGGAKEAKRVAMFRSIRLAGVSWLFSVLTIGASASSAGENDLFDFRLPSTVVLSISQSSTETKSAAASLRVMLPKNFWIEFAGDQATEVTDGFETTTLGGSVALGTDPIEDYALDLGIDRFGVSDQYSVREGRARFTAMPNSIFGRNNPGIEVTFEYRLAAFEFVNQPNPIFKNTSVKLEARTLRTEFGFYMLSPWTIRLFFERVALDQGFQDLNRPLAPLFIPETAISTAISWPSEEDGISLSYGAKKWGARVGASRKVAAVTLDKSFLTSVGVDYRWSKAITSVIRYSNSKSENDPSLQAIDSVGLEFAYSFY
jgi:hypothetical protein